MILLYLLFCFVLYNAYKKSIKWHAIYVIMGNESIPSSSSIANYCYFCTIDYDYCKLLLSYIVLLTYRFLEFRRIHLRLP